MLLRSITEAVPWGGLGAQEGVWSDTGALATLLRRGSWARCGPPDHGRSLETPWIGAIAPPEKILGVASASCRASSFLWTCSA